ncbi:MAG: hypothetical protein IPK79_12545 [Vampirovibrionales bacterium]|nr:hypothetical protein [Vampirovibrionales bacterium]
MKGSSKSGRKHASRPGPFQPSIIEMMPRTLAYLSQCLDNTEDSKSQQWAATWVLRLCPKETAPEATTPEPHDNPDEAPLSIEALAAMSDDEVMSRLMALLNDDAPPASEARHDA